MFSFLFFFFPIYVLSISLKNIHSFLSFFYMQCSTVFMFPFFSSMSFFHFPVPFFVFLFFFFFFFHNKLLLHCTFLKNPISASHCLYPNSITIGSLPRLFNFNPWYHKLSLVYNKTFLCSLRVLFFFYLTQNIPVVFFFLNNPNFYQFSQQHFPIQNNSKSESANFFSTSNDHQDSVHILIT